MFGSLFSAGSSLLGGVVDYFGNKSANDANKDMQYDFAKQGIRWKVEDAQAAGIHPLYALGAQTISPSPSFVGSTLGNSISNAGQDISRAINSTRTAGERRLAELQLSSAKADLDGKLIDNQIRASQLAKMNQVQTPSFPSGTVGQLIPGQGDSSRVIDAPLTRTISARGAPNQEPAPVTETGYLRTPSGGYFPVRSKDATDRLDDDTIGNLLWNFRNRVLPSFGFNYSLPNDANIYNPLTQQYERMPAWAEALTPRGVVRSIKSWYNR